MVAGPTRAKRGYHHGDLRRSMMAATLELVAERGVRGFALTEAARRAGVSPSAPYRHFAHRDELLAAVAIDGFRALYEATEPAAARPDAVAEFAQTYVAFALADPARFEVMSASRLNKEELQALRHETERLKRLLVEIVAPLVTADEQVDETVVQLFGIVHGIGSLAVEGRHDHIAPGVDPVRTARSAVEAWASGKRAVNVGAARSREGR